jgi:hypothetical protein
LISVIVVCIEENQNCVILEYYCHNPDSIKRVNKLERKKFWNIAKSGMNCQLDLSNSWDYESNYRKSLTELRKEFNLK